MPPIRACNPEGLCLAGGVADVNSQHTLPANCHDEGVREVTRDRTQFQMGLTKYPTIYRIVFYRQPPHVVCRKKVNGV